MENKEEIINSLKEREEYLEGEWYQLGDIADKMGGIDSLIESDSRDAKDLIEAITSTWKALKAVRRMIEREAKKCTGGER